ncbi:nucleotide sugar dehydrogenase [Piromyces finnis]|uniref:UDP-glucose 6-dehydrogenase n=1 Tax=Piromyces finnis TaxID=1754191 RepID=A0A1Y1UXZ7_9FUNG|nr:nucleotide sugar dehydrogenase [Piromyces finnis]|eukprot:ORX42451.1 nucleotide sugar dehydrogenase [Piromyces finnis]
MLSSQISPNSPITQFNSIKNFKETFEFSNNSILSNTNVNQISGYPQNIYSEKTKENINTCSFGISPLETPINICFIGAGYVGGTSSAVMAYKCPENMVKVTVCDISHEKINAWNSDKLPIYEPGLEDIVKKQRGKNLFFTTDLNSSIDASDIIFISVGTPTKKKGFGAGQAADLKYVECAARKIAQISKNSKIIVEKSTVPCRTAEHIRTILDSNKLSHKQTLSPKNHSKNNNNISNSINKSNNFNYYYYNSELNIKNEDFNVNNFNINYHNDNINNINNNDDYNNSMDSSSISNNDSTLTDIDSCSESNTFYQGQEQELNKSIFDDLLEIKLKKNRNIENEKSSCHFEILSNPEFLSEGTAINDLLYPDRVLIGGLQTKEGIKAQNLLYQLYSYWIPKEKIITMSLWSSELSKLAANALLAQRISSINALSALCEEVGADIQEVSYACGLDTRIGSKFLNASIGFGGSCFKKDILNLVYLCNVFKLPEVADYWMQVIKMNEYRKTKFIKNILNRLFNTLSGKSITVFGFSFKKNTKDTRESAAITIVMALLQENAIIKIYDPKVTKEQIYYDIKENSDPQEFNENISNTIICDSAYDAAHKSDAIIICTEWDEFTTLNYQNIYNNMNKPAFIFDGRLILNHNKLKKIGFIVEAIGKKI